MTFRIYPECVLGLVGGHAGKPEGMGFITRSGIALVALAGAAALYAVGALFLSAAFAGLTPSDLRVVSDLTHAGDWLRFAGAVVALGAVCEAGWQLGSRTHPINGRAGDRVLISPLGEAPRREVPLGQRKATAIRTGPHVETPTEVATDAVIVAIGVLLVSVGLLVTATAGRVTAASGILGGLGFVLLGLLLLWRSYGNTPELVAGLATLGFSIGYAMVATTTDTGGQVAAGVLQALAAATVAASIVAARPREYLWTGAWRAPFLRPVVGGLLLLTVAYVAMAITSGVVYSGNATLTDIRVGPAVAYTLEGIGIAMFGWAAAWRVFLANQMQRTH
jgi:hypothetical protein